MNTKTKSLFAYIFPALGGLFVTYLYNVMDGIFVGQGVGSAALGAVNIGVPFITFVVAIAAMFPMGGATVVAIRMGRGDKDGANHAFMTAFSLTVLLSILLMVVGMAFSQQIVDLSGAGKLSEEMRKMSADYLFYYSAFSIPMLMSTCLSVFFDIQLSRCSWASVPVTVYATPEGASALKNLCTQVVLTTWVHCVFQSRCSLRHCVDSDRDRRP